MLDMQTYQELDSFNLGTKKVDYCSYDRHMVQLDC